MAAAHDRAAARAFAELEAFAACRVRAGAAAWSQDTRATGNVCAAVFRHDASRALDPQLHTHFVVANATWDEEKGRMVALESCEMVKAIRYRRQGLSKRAGPRGPGPRLPHRTKPQRKGHGGRL